MKNAHTIQGRSFVLNAFMILLNLAGMAFLTMGFHPNFETSKWLYVGIGAGLLILSIIGIVMLKGRLFMAYVSRVLVGSLFIVSGLIKANDPLGFSYKLKEYFEDGALAFRIKEWFGMPGFSLEFFMDYAVLLSVLICVAEIVLGVLALIGGKIRLVSWLLMLLMLFFTFLTWHTANCNADIKFKDRDTYALTDPVALDKIEEAKTNKEIRIVSKSNGKLVVDEMKQPQCVSDCGCFGDAMKGSVGRSLTPSESLWKDIILLYLVVWIFITQRRIVPNSVKDNLYIVPVSLLLIIFFSFVFDWYFPFFFGLVAILGALWIVRAGGRIFGNHWGSALVVTILCGAMTAYVLLYEPIRDYRPYAVGTNLKEKMNDGVDGKYVNLLVYSNLKNGAKKEFDGSSQAYINSKIWEKTDTWKFDTTVTKELIPTRIPSISGQFNPLIPVGDIGEPERQLKYVAEQLKEARVKGVLLHDKENNADIEVMDEEYNVTDYDTAFFSYLKPIEMDNPALSEISIRDFIVDAPTIFVLFSKNLSEADFSEMEVIREIYNETQQRGIPFVMVCSSGRDEINAWRQKHHFNVPVFINDETELKAIARSNPSLMIVQNGVVKGKYPHRSLPTFNWISKHILQSK